LFLIDKTINPRSGREANTFNELFASKLFLERVGKLVVKVTFLVTVS
jgi:hypothetical protein